MIDIHIVLHFWPLHKMSINFPFSSWHVQCCPVGYFDTGRAQRKGQRRLEQWKWRSSQDTIARYQNIPISHYLLYMDLPWTYRVDMGGRWSIPKDDDEAIAIQNTMDAVCTVPAPTSLKEQGLLTKGSKQEQQRESLAWWVKVHHANIFYTVYKSINI